MKRKKLMFCGFSPEMNVLQFPPDLCVSSLHALFRLEPDIAVSYTMYIQHMECNIGTRQPCMVLVGPTRI